jgi:hypothetical protein
MIGEKSKIQIFVTIVDIIGSASHGNSAKELLFQCFDVHLNIFIREWEKTKMKVG